MTYLRIPQEISIGELRSKGSLSPAMYHRVDIQTRRTRLVRELIHGYDKGSDPGSRHYLRRSSHYFIRTKALQTHSWLLYPKGGSITPVNPRVFVEMALRDGDILLSKDSNIGECAMVDGDGWGKHMLSGGVVRLRPKIDRHYLFAFMKHPLFKTELVSMVPRGSTIAHANELWLDCRIPFPTQSNADDVIAYVAALAEAIVDKEKAIRAKDAEMLSRIEWQLANNQGNSVFQYVYPTSHEIRELTRIDASIHGLEYKSKIYIINNYVDGSKTPTEGGFIITPGPSLEIRILKTRLDSDVERPGFYELLIPANMTEYGTMERRAWIGTSTKLPLLNNGDILFGEAGFNKGRSIVVLDSPERTTTNAHGLYARRTDGNIEKSIFFRCIFHWYRSQRLIDLMAVGGSGGHFSPDYFDFIRIPNFPDPVQQDIARLYHNPVPPPATPPTVANFVACHRARNVALGIWELDLEIKALKAKLAAAQEDIIEGRTVALS